MNPAAPEVLTAGEAMGLVITGDGVPLARAQTFVRGIAGSESNVAIGLARLGHRVTFVGRVGADAVGEWVAGALRAEGVDARLGCDRNRPTGLLLRDRPLGRALTVAYYRTGSAATALSAADVDTALVASARVVFVSGITAVLSDSAADFVDRLLDVALDAAVPVAFDPNVRLRLADVDVWRRSFARLAGRPDILLIGAEEQRLLALPDDPAELLAGRTHTVVVTDGARGATVTTAAGTVHEPAHPSVPVDPVGAGDAFTAGWLSAWLRGRSTVEGLREAAVVAALSVAVPTDTAGLPTADERDRALVNGADVDR